MDTSTGQSGSPFEVEGQSDTHDECGGERCGTLEPPGQPPRMQPSPEAPKGPAMDDHHLFHPNSRMVTWITHHPAAAATVAVALGVAFVGGYFRYRTTSGKKSAGQVAPDVRHAGGRRTQPKGPAASSIEGFVAGGLSALAVSLISKWAIANAAPEIDPVADLADTDAFAQAPAAEEDQLHDDHAVHLPKNPLG